MLISKQAVFMVARLISHKRQLGQEMPKIGNNDWLSRKSQMGVSHWVK
jgi:hypothetical protein